MLLKAVDAQVFALRTVLEETVSGIDVLIANRTMLVVPAIFDKFIICLARVREVLKAQ